MSMPLIPAFVLLPAFYAENFGLGLSQTGIILLLVRLTDVVSDPVVGWISDYLRRWQWGQKSQITIGALVAGFALFKLFTPPADPDATYLFLWYSLMLLGWTIVQIPYLAWTVNLSTDYSRRASFNAARELAGLLGILLFSLALLLTANMDQAEQLRLTSVLILLCGAAVFPLLLTLPASINRQSPPNFRNPLAGLKRNRLFFRLIFAWFLSGLSIGIATACFPLFIRHNLQLPEAYNSYFLFIYFLAGIAGIPLWIWLSRSIGKHRTWVIAMCIASFTFFTVLLIGPGQVLPFGAICIVTGLALGADLALPPAIQSDLADWDNYLNRIDRSSVLFALWGMATKLSLGLGVAFAFGILGGSQTAAGHTTEPLAINLTLLAVIYGGLPAVLKLAAATLMWRFPLGAKQHAAVRKRIDRR